MVKLLHVGAVLLAGVAVAIADALIKRAATKDIWSAVKDPLMIGVLLLYVAQVAFFLYVFSRGVELGIAGVLQIAFYAITTVLIGWVVFSETLSILQLSGIAVALIGVVMMNWS